MAKRKSEKPENMEDIRVKLKPLLGIQPGVYLTVLYAAVLAIILFFILLYPGIRNNGARITCVTSPAGVRVLIDGRYAGETPCTVFAARGERTVRFERDFFTPVEERISVPGRVFGSLLFPRKLALRRQLELADTAGFLEAAFREACGWALIDSYHANYQKPPVLRDIAETLTDAGVPGDTVEDFFESSMALVANEPMLRDFILARFEARKADGVLTINNALEMLQDYIQYLDEHPAFLFWLPEALSSENRQRVTDGDWFLRSASGYGENSRNFSDSQQVRFARIPLGDGAFIGLRGGSFMLGRDSGTEYRVPVNLGDMYILDREVTRGMFEDFISANPEWAPSNRETLAEQGLVDASYLADFEQAGRSGDPVRFVSYFAASAYCLWLEEQLTDLPEGWTVRLPFEAEWEWAALSDDRYAGTFQKTGITGPVPANGNINPLGIYDMSGNLWEWCENWYYPAGYTVTNGYSPAAEPRTFETGVEKAVRGGSWANRREDVTIRTRGSQPAEWCTPFTGFRPVIVRE